MLQLRLKLRKKAEPKVLSKLGMAYGEWGKSYFGTKWFKKVDAVTFWLDRLRYLKVRWGGAEAGGGAGWRWAGGQRGVLQDEPFLGTCLFALSLRYIQYHNRAMPPEAERTKLPQHPVMSCCASPTGPDH